MAAQEIGSLFVALGLDSAAFTSGVKTVSGLSGKLQKVFQQIGDKAVVAGKALSVVSGAMAAVGGSLSGLVVYTTLAAKQIARQAEVSNATTDEFQRWAAGSKTVGIEQEKLANILKDVNDKFGEFNATGGGPMLDFFTNVAPKVGLTADAFKDLSGPQALQLYVSSLEKAGLSQQEMTFYMEALGSDATALLPLLRNGGAEMTRFGDAAAGTGAIMSEKLIGSSKEFNEKLQVLFDRVTGVKNRLVEALMPVVNQFIDLLILYGVPALDTMAGAIEGLIGWFGGLSEPVQIAVGVIATALGIGGPVLLAVGAMSTAFSMLLAGTGPVGLFIAAAGIAAAAWQIWGDDIKRIVGVAVDWVVGKFNEIVGAIKDAITWATTLGENIAIALGKGRDLQLQRDLGFVFVDGQRNPNAIGADTAAGLVTGFGTGLQSSEAEIRRYIQEGLVKPTEDELGIKSPSRVFMAIGKFITEGLGLGIQQGLPQVREAMNGVADEVNGDGMTEGLFKFRDAARDVFSQVAFQGKKLGDVLRNMASSWLSDQASNLFTSGFNGLWDLLKLPSYARGTDNFRGGLARVNERGGEIMNLPGGTQIIPNDISKRMADGTGMGGRLQVVVTMDESTGSLGAFVRNEAGNVVARAAPQIVKQSVGAVVAMSKKTKSALS